MPLPGGRAPRRPAGRGISGARWRPRWGGLPSLRPCSPALPGPARGPGGRVDAGSPALRLSSVRRRGGPGSCSGCGGAPFILPDLPDLPNSLRFPPAGGARLSPFGRSPLRGGYRRFPVRFRAVRRTRAGRVIFRGGVRKSSYSCTDPSNAGAMRSSRFLVCAAGEDRPFAAAPGAVDRLLGEAGTRAFFAPQAGFSRCLGGVAGFVRWSRPGGCCSLRSVSAWTGRCRRRGSRELRNSSQGRKIQAEEEQKWEQ